MERRIHEGVMVTVSFIPEKFAKVGEVVKLKNEDGRWTDGWVVKRVGQSTTFDSKKAIRQHRKNTGDSLPKETKK
jgi:hypothetical protein